MRQGFDEGDITFAPTFKFDNGTDTYDSSAKVSAPAAPGCVGAQQG